MRALAALIRSGYEAHQAAELAAVLDLPPSKNFGGQRPGANRADPTKGGQGVEIPAHRGVWIGRERRALGVQFLERAVQERKVRPSTLEPCFQPCRDRRPVPPLRHLELRRKIRVNGQRGPLREHRPFQTINQPSSILLYRLSRPMELPGILLAHARHAYHPPPSIPSW